MQHVHGFQKTIDALAKSHNEAAVSTLLAALPMGSGPVFDGALLGLCSRRNKGGHLEVLRLWPSLNPTQKAIVEKGRHKMGGALRHALLEGDDVLFAAARDFVESSGDFDLIPTLVVVAEQPNGERSQVALDLTARLIDQLLHWIDSDRTPAVGRDPETIRYSVMESLERSVERFANHQRGALLEAFVVLAGPHSKTLLNILEAPHHACHASVAHTLAQSSNPLVIRLIINIMLGLDAPLPIRQVVSKRTDRPFVEALLAMPIDLKTGPLKRNLAKIKSIACCEAPITLCSQYNAEQQAAAMHLLAATGAADEQKLTLAETLIKHGAVDGRLAACNALRPVGGQRANKLIELALQDPEGIVQAAAVQQLRQRRIPGTMATLVELVDSENELVSAAAREALAEFSFDNYSSRFDVLDEEARRAMGTRVAKIDRTTLDRLREELANPIRRTRLRAMEMAASMEVLPQLADALVERLQDDDHLVRVAAADALAFCTSNDVRSALLTAVGDKSIAVQNAARNSLRALEAEPAKPRPAVAEAVR